MKFIDISIPIENNVKSDPPGYEPEVEYLDHHTTANEMLAFFPGLKKDDLPLCVFDAV